MDSVRVPISSTSTFNAATPQTFSLSQRLFLLARQDKKHKQLSVGLHHFDLLWICVQYAIATLSCRSTTTNPRQIESEQQLVHNKSTASCMQQSASLAASRTTRCTTNRQLVEVVESDTYCACVSVAFDAWNVGGVERVSAAPLSLVVITLFTYRLDQRARITLVRRRLYVIVRTAGTAQTCITNVRKCAYFEGTYLRSIYGASPAI